MDKRPALPVAVDRDTTRVLIGPDGTKYESLEMVYTEYDLGRIRSGYCCMECGEAQETSFPEKCPICAYPIRRDQAQRFAEEFDGPTTIGPARSLAELRAEDEEAKARARYQREKPTSSIWIPG